jgi:hypothetical protein
MQEIKSLDEPENFEIKVVEISFEVLKWNINLNLMKLNLASSVH